ncbi:MAG: chemotaxis protein CheW [Alphaproteobacteria bacterium]
MSASAIKDILGDNSTSKDYLTLTIAGQLFGIQVLQVEDVLRKQNLTIVPLAPKEISGSLNLRGRIVTAINVREALGLPPPLEDEENSDMSVVVEHEGELYSLIIDKVGDVLSLNKENFQDNPATLDAKWLSVSAGIYRLENELMVILDVSKLIGNIHQKDLKTG